MVSSPRRSKKEHGIRIMGTSSKQLQQKLRKLAHRQQGCFTAAQAIKSGYADSVHLYHVRNGQWIRVYRGVYRFADAPETPAARCMAALLWTRDKNGKVQGGLASETAEALHAGHLDANQPIQITVPKGFRRSSAVPAGIVLSTLSGQHKTSIIEKISDSPPVSGHVQNMPAALSPPDYYDWLDYQAVRGGPPC